MNDQDNPRNRRQRERLSLSLPIRVQCRENLTEKWEEITRLIDVTPFGAGFLLPRALDVGRLLLLTIPMPRQLRCYDHVEQQYRVWSLVRHVRKLPLGKAQTVNYSIGVAFIGKNPPLGYAENPAKLYEVLEPDAVGFWRVREATPVAAGESRAGTNRQTIDMRRHSRLTISATVMIEVFNERGETVASEMTVTENISLTGALVFTTLEIERGRFVRMNCEQYDVTIVAIVRARKTGKDGVARLHLEFIDRQFPLELTY